MTVTLEHIHVDDWPAIALENDLLRLVVIPELGGKIVSLVSQRTQREWLWRNPYLPLARPPLNVTNFGHFDSGGWDEIFPTVDPCRIPKTPWGERLLTDHGELWYRPWRTISEKANNDAASLALAVQPSELPFQFERVLTLTSEGPLEIGYRLTNLCDQELPYLWAAHPLVAIRSGDEIRLPAGCRVSSTAWLNLDPAQQAIPFAWPHLDLSDGRSLDLSHVSKEDGSFAIKMFAEDISPRAVTIVGSDKVGLRLEFSAPMAHCGLWLNCGAWSGADTEPYFNLGVEPTSSLGDNLAKLLESGQAKSLAPFEILPWKLWVTSSEMAKNRC